MYNNHLKIGYITVKHKNKDVVTSIGSDEFQSFIDNIEDYEYDVGHIPPGLEHRADLISNLFYGTPTMDWLICWANNIKDPFQQLNIRDQIRIPRLL